MNEENIDNIKINGYEIRSSYSRTISKHGGVMILTKQNTKTELLKEIANITMVEKTFEATGIYISSIHSAIVGVYRSPVGCVKIFLEKLDTLLSLLTRNVKYKYIYVVGDFNIDVIPETPDKQNLLNLFYIFGLLPLFRDPSRVNIAQQDMY